MQKVRFSPLHVLRHTWQELSQTQSRCVSVPKSGGASSSNRQSVFHSKRIRTGMVAGRTRDRVPDRYVRSIQPLEGEAPREAGPSSSLSQTTGTTAPPGRRMESGSCIIGQKAGMSFTISTRRQAAAERSSISLILPRLESRTRDGRPMGNCLRSDTSQRHRRYSISL